MATHCSILARRILRTESTVHGITQSDMTVTNTSRFGPFLALSFLCSCLVFAYVFLLIGQGLSVHLQVGFCLTGWCAPAHSS